MSHYKPYTAYKESGVGWIEPIPKHWDIVRIKRFTTLNTARTSEARDNIPYIGLEDVELLYNLIGFCLNCFKTGFYHPM